MGIQCRGISGDTFGQQCRSFQFAKQIQVIIAGRTIGTQSHIDAGICQLCHRAEAAGQFQVGFRTVDHMAVVLLQQANIARVHLSHMNQLGLGQQNTQVIQSLGGTAAVEFQGVANLLGCFLAVNMHRHIQLVGIGGDTLQGFITHGIGGMGSAGNFNQLVIFVAVPQAEALVNIVVGILASGGGKIKHRKAHLAAHTADTNLLGNRIGKEVHIGKTGSAGADHLGHRQAATIGNKFFTENAVFHRPDMLLQPGFQWLVIGVAPQQTHGGMAVAIDQPRHQHMVVQLDHRSRLKFGFSLGLGIDTDDFLLVYSQGAILVDTVLRNDRNYPSAVD